MRVLMMSWEYPPFSVGGLAQHVYELSRAMVEAGIDVDVISTSTSRPSEETDNGVTVHRVVPYHGRSLNFITWVQQLNLAMMEKGSRLMHRGKSFDIIHAHDWLAAYASRGLKHIYNIPLMATIHATEYGRNGGLYTEEQRFVGDVEWWLCFEAWKVICCSKYMETELYNLFELPRNKVEIIPNGIRPEAFQIESENPAIRKRFAPRGEKVIFYVGRLVQEKGVQVLLKAAPLVKERFPDVRFVIAGSGPHEEELHRMSGVLGLDSFVEFAGYIDDETRNQLYGIASAAVFPSLYEPFGIVALEAMASGTPVVVGDVGGFKETVKHGVNGLKAMPDDHVNLAEQISFLLTSPESSQEINKNALEEIKKKFSWKGIALQTGEIYHEVITSPDAEAWRKEVEESDAGSKEELQPTIESRPAFPRSKAPTS